MARPDISEMYDEMYDELMRDYEDMKNYWAIKERIRDIESEMACTLKPKGYDSHERAHGQGWIDALKWVIEDEVDHAIREVNNA